MTPPLTQAPPFLGFFPLDIPQNYLLLRQRRFEPLMFVMFLEPLFIELSFRRREYRLSKPLDSQFTDERQPCRCKEHLLPYWSSIRYISYGDEGRRVGGGVTAEDYVEGNIGLQVGS